MTTPQLELIPRTLIAPAPADQCGEQVPADDGRGFHKPDYSASLGTRHLHDPRWWGRLIRCRPGDASDMTRPQWRRLIRVYSLPRNPEWPAEDPDGSQHVCLVACNCEIAATRHEWENGAIPLPDIPNYRALDE